MDFLSNDLEQYITEDKVKKKNRKCEHGKIKYYCKECGGTGLCKHERRKDRCKDCGGSSLCNHNRIKYECKECTGSAFCKHGKHKTRCKECGGSGICKHGKTKTYCKECSTNTYCIHNREKRRCKDCGGTGICKHGRDKIKCKECDGSAFCIHNKWKHICKDCCGSSICIHGKHKRLCLECGGQDLCIHNKQKKGCKECGGSDFCKHGKRKRRCKECGGHDLCKSSWCETLVRKKYEGYCLYCFMYLFPDKKVARNYKTKEKDVVDRVKETYPDFDWIHDKKVQDGCSKRRPDLLLDLGYHIIIIEIDEYQHSGYDTSCENKRLMELSQDVHHRPIVFIRFNPDKYVDSEGNTIKSCWRLNKSGVMTVMKTKEEEWIKRIDKLKETIQFWIVNSSDKTVEIVELFY